MEVSLSVFFWFLCVAIANSKSWWLDNAKNSQTYIPCPDLCKCFRKKNAAICSGHGKHVSEIPALPRFVRQIHLDSDYFPWITRQRLQILIPNNITYISFKGSYVHHTDSDAFADLPELDSLDLSANVKLNTTSLKLALSSFTRKEFNLFVFDMMRWNSADLSMKLFTHLNGRYINRLTLVNNVIEHIPTGSFDGLEDLRRLDLSTNKLKTCENSFKELSSLTEITLSSNPITSCIITNFPSTIKKINFLKDYLLEVPNFCSANKTSLLPNLTHLILDNNLIMHIAKHSFDCLPSLRHLSLRQNNIQHIPSHTFSRLSRLLVLDLSEMKNGIHNTEENAFDIPSLSKLNFLGNGFKFYIPQLAQKATFRRLSNLQVLQLSGNFLPKWPDVAKDLFGGLKNLQTLRARNVRWNIVPNELFKLMPSLTKVALSQNGITNLNYSLFSEKSLIREMALDNNRIAHVGENTFTHEFWKSIKKFDLSGNPFVCDCNLLWFRDKLRKSNIKFKNYPTSYQCLAPPSRKGLHLRNFNLTSSECKKKSELVVILSSTGSICLFLLIAIIVIYKGRWHIRYWIYLMRYKRSSGGYTRIEDHDFKYDGFVIYCDEDSEFVHDTLLTRLEDEEQYRLCIHFRDFDVGKIIVDNIVDNMSDSRHAIVIVSGAFCRSKWCKFELLVAQDRWLSHESGALVVVMLEEINSKYLSKDLRALIQTTTYSIWTVDAVGQQLFWNQLLSALKSDWQTILTDFKNAYYLQIVRWAKSCIEQRRI